jgi:hypothetical protein
MDSPERGRFDLSSLRVLQVGGAKLNPEPARRIRPTLGCQLQQVFGMAEGLLNYTRLDDPEDEIVETQGRPCSPDDEIRVVDEEGRDVPPGEPGELLARGPYTIRGYYNVPEHNQRAFTPDGFYRSGDIVRLSPGGNLVVEGRAKDLINRGGEKISAEEVENLVLAHPSVFNAAAVAMPDPVLGERTCVYVILRPGAGLTLTELVTFLEAQQIARFKLPERLEVVEKFPLTNVGKVSKKDLREDIARKLASERAAQLIQRLQAAVADVLRQADRLGPQDAYGRPEADAWSAAEILAHLVEMLPYWSEQAQAVAVRSQNGEPFGRTHDDPQRITAVRDHAHDDPRELVVGLRTSLDRAMALLRAIPSACWLRTGRHARRGEMTVAQIVEQFLVEHAEEHAHQLAATLDTEAHA